MDGGRSPPDGNLDTNGGAGSSSSGSTPDTDRDGGRGGVSHEGAVEGAAGSPGGGGGGDGQNLDSYSLPAPGASGEGGGRRSVSAGGSSRRFASVDDGLRQPSRSLNRPSQEGSASRRSLSLGSGSGSRGFASLDGPPRRPPWRQRLSLSLAQPSPSSLGRPDSASLDEIVVDMDRLEQAAGDKGF